MHFSVLHSYLSCKVAEHLFCFSSPRALCKRLRLSRAIINLLIGTIAGAINVCFVQPLWVANARLKLQGINGVNNNGKVPYRSTLDVIQRILREEVCYLCPNWFRKIFAKRSEGTPLLSCPCPFLLIYPRDEL